MGQRPGQPPRFPPPLFLQGSNARGTLWARNCRLFECRCDSGRPVGGVGCAVDEVFESKVSVLLLLCHQHTSVSVHVSTSRRASMRGVLVGVVLAIGAQLLFVLLLRTLWARRALASLDSWLQRTFGVSLRLSSLSSSSSNGRSGSFGKSDQMEGEGDSDLWGQNGNGRPLSRAGSNASSSSAYSNGSSAGSGERCGVVQVDVVDSQLGRSALDYCWFMHACVGAAVWQGGGVQQHIPARRLQRCIQHVLGPISCRPCSCIHIDVLWLQQVQNCALRNSWQLSLLPACCVLSFAMRLPPTPILSLRACMLNCNHRVNTDRAAMTAVDQKAPGESVEWVNMLTPCCLLSCCLVSSTPPPFPSPPLLRLNTSTNTQTGQQ
jgi:hypothetical protein